MNGVLHILMVMETGNKTDCCGLLPSGQEASNENGYSSVTNLLTFFALATSVLPIGDIMRYFVKRLQKNKIHFFFCIRRPYDVVKRDRTLKLV